MGIEPKQTAARSPWQNGVAERWIESCRRELCARSVPSRAGQGRSGHALAATAAECASSGRRTSPTGRPASPLRLARSRVKTVRIPPLPTRLRAASLQTGRALVPGSCSTQGVAPSRIPKTGVRPGWTGGPRRSYTSKPQHRSPGSQLESEHQYRPASPSSHSHSAHRPSTIDARECKRAQPPTSLGVRPPSRSLVSGQSSPNATFLGSITDYN